MAWATLVEAILGALAIVAVFYTYTGALGTGPILWVDITPLYWLSPADGGCTCGSCCPARPRFRRMVSLLGLLALLALYAIWTVAPPDLPVFQPG